MLHGLKTAGLAANAPPPYTMPPHRLLVYLEKEYPGVRTMLENNLIVISDRIKSGGRPNYVY